MNNNYPKRKNIRLKGYDYSKEGMYFITICTKNRLHLLSNIINVHTYNERADRGVCPYAKNKNKWV